MAHTHTHSHTGYDQEETLLLVQAGEPDYTPLHWQRLSADAQRVVRGLLNVKPAERPTAAQLLADPWVQQGVPPPPDDGRRRPSVEVREILDEDEEEAEGQEQEQRTAVVAAAAPQQQQPAGAAGAPADVRPAAT